MRKVVLAIFALFLSFQIAGAQGINFQNITIDQAMARAKAENKLVFVDVYTDWCGPCKQLDRTTFANARVGEQFNQNFINIKVNAEDEGEGTAFARQHEIQAYPTMLFLDSDGKVVHRILGFKTAEVLLDEIRVLVQSAKYGGKDAMVQSFNDGKRDLEFLVDLYKILPESDTKGRGEVALAYLLIAPDEVLFDPIGESNMELITNMFGDLPRFDSKLDERLLNGWKVLYGNDGAPKTVTGDYYLGVMGSYEGRISKMLQMAIDRGDRRAMEAMITAKQKWPTDRNIVGHVYDGFNVMTGRGLFYADSEFNWLAFMVANNEPAESFRPLIVSYMDKVMKNNPLEALDNRYATTMKLKEEQEFQFKSNLYMMGMYSDLAIEQLIKWAIYYWYVSPSNKETRELCATWIEYALRLNRFNSTSIFDSTPFMLKLGKKREQIRNIERSLETFEQVEEYKGHPKMPKLVEPTKLLLQRVKDDKAF